jgi:DNA polymerase alpha-associated DNA helicase A
MSSLTPIDIPSFATTQLTLLENELATELSETSLLISNTSPTTLAKAGLAITNLVLVSQRTGLGGKTVIELGLDPAIGKAKGTGTGPGGANGGELQDHGIRVGDIVLVSELPAGGAKKREVRELEAKGARGVVVKVQIAGVGVALDREEDDGDRVVEGKRLWVVKLANDVTFKR